MKHLMSGNEATARGVYEAGIKVCSAYPGTPSTEILENLPQYGKDVYCEGAPMRRWPPRWLTARPWPAPAPSAP